MSGEIVTGVGALVSLGGPILKVRGFALKFQADIEDSTCFSDLGWHTRTLVTRDYSGSFDSIAFPGDIVGSTVVGSFTTGGQTGSKVYSGSCIIESIDPAVDALKMSVFRCTFLGHGALTIT